MKGQDSLVANAIKVATVKTTAEIPSTSPIVPMAETCVRSTQTRWTSVSGMVRLSWPTYPTIVSRAS